MNRYRAISETFFNYLGNHAPSRVFYCMDAQGGVGVIGGGHGGASSPTSIRNGTANAKRKRSGAGFESSPGSVDIAENEEDEAERRRQPGVKRACNECRQQKVR